MEGLTLAVDKPLGWTSFDVVNKLRYAARSAGAPKGIKVGHAGTLDPLATGLVIVCFGKHTKTIESLVEGRKTYTGTIFMGATTPSLDGETAVSALKPIEEIPLDQLRIMAAAMCGVYQQLPPDFSAKKVDGVVAYNAARKGRSLGLSPKAVEIHHFEIVSVAWPEVHFRLVCGKGTYVRSLARDFAERLGTLAYLTGLRRTQVGTFTEPKMLGIDAAVNHVREAFSVAAKSV